MMTGLLFYDPENNLDCIFFLMPCNILWETQATDIFKWDYNEKYYPLIFEQLRKQPRSVPIPGFSVGLPLKETVMQGRELRNELDVVVKVMADAVENRSAAEENAWGSGGHMDLCQDEPMPCSRVSLDFPH
ncbi:hypothetical protein H2200_000806 [Cladophialophora chaetospira]|uniref:Uncharacterized protein n=1 Tax=Cladophialophora chaetospira TaxID=386627 RepID=A0AA38XP57_9EURO|nr:hypothetical protein H2200_000806 [Cladophialophora chaetospira]